MDKYKFLVERLIALAKENVHLENEVARLSKELHQSQMDVSMLTAMLEQVNPRASRGQV